MGDNDCENNNFEFNGDNADPDPSGDPPVPSDPPIPGPDYCVSTFDAAKNDAVDETDQATGIRCPFIAHTRKAYPRNDRTPGGIGGDRTRKFFIRLVNNNSEVKYVELTAPEDWVVATGGGYFFSPSITALSEQLT
ncbi:MAG: Dyp-type peroxidase family [Chthonomonadales bacterium]|nr:Dyp-type peroxidase family [Chthonomonadales bacterium]